MSAPPADYVPRDPRAGVLHPLVKQAWPELVDRAAAEGQPIPRFVSAAFERYLKCGIAEAGFLRLGCAQCGTQRALPLSCKCRGLCPSCGTRRMHDLSHHLVERVLPDVPLRQYVLSPPAELVGLLGARSEVLSAMSRIFVRCVFDAIRRRVGGEGSEGVHCGSVVVIQLFSKSIALFPHVHLLAFDGAYVERDEETLEFCSDRGPSSDDVRALEDDVMQRFTRWLRANGYLDEEPNEAEGLDGWFGPAGLDVDPGPRPAGKRRDSSRFSVHAKVRVEADDRRGREHLTAYLARPPLAEEQLERLDDERIRLTFRNPTRGPSSSVILHPLQLVRRLAWQVPPPNLRLVRYAGVLAPAARLRHRVVPAGRIAIQGTWFGARKFESLAPVASRVAWAALLAKVYQIDVRCPQCDGPLRPVGAVLPPHAQAWIERRRILVLDPTGPPPKNSPQLELPLAS